VTEKKERRSSPHLLQLVINNQEKNRRGPGLNSINYRYGEEKREQNNYYQRGLIGNEDCKRQDRPSSRTSEALSWTRAPKSSRRFGKKVEEQKNCFFSRECSSWRRDSSTKVKGLRRRKVPGQEIDGMMGEDKDSPLESSLRKGDGKGLGGESNLRTSIFALISKQENSCGGPTWEAKSQPCHSTLHVRRQKKMASF